MTRFWIRNAGAAESAGPFTLEELRGLIRAEVLPGTVLVSLDAFAGFRPAADWPELIAALNDSGVRTLPGETALTLGTLWTAPGEPESQAGIAARESTLKLGNANFEDINKSDPTGEVDVVRMLRENVEAEAPKEFHFPPWHRAPLARNLARFSAFAAIASVFLILGLRHLYDPLPMLPVSLVALGAALLGVGAWYVFVIAPARWDSR